MRLTNALNFVFKPLFKYRAMRNPSFDEKINDEMTIYGDYYRLATMALAVQRISDENILGCFAEVGVFKGNISKFIHKLAPHKKYYLFDTFTGFNENDLGEEDKKDSRFGNTSIEEVSANIGDLNNIFFKKGYVPDTLNDVKDDLFSFVLLDLDKYKPTFASLEFFYPRLTKGAYLFVHDVNCSESVWACKKALTEFMHDKKELIIEIADICGSALFRKI
jgi:O-methyltransferase